MFKKSNSKANKNSKVNNKTKLIKSLCDEDNKLRNRSLLHL